MTYLEAVKALAHKAGFDEVTYKEVVLALVTEHGSADEKKQAKEWAIGKEVSDKEAAYEAEVEKRIAARKTASKPAAKTSSSKKKVAA